MQGGAGSNMGGARIKKLKWAKRKQQALLGLEKETEPVRFK